jgi:hypothetical protein
MLIASGLDPSLTDTITGTINSDVYAVSKNEIAVKFSTSDLRNALFFEITLNKNIIPVNDLTTRNNVIYFNVDSTGTYDVNVVAKNLGSSSLFSNTISINNSATNLLNNVVRRFVSQIYPGEGYYLAYRAEGQDTTYVYRTK